MLSNALHKWAPARVSEEDAPILTAPKRALEEPWPYLPRLYPAINTLQNTKERGRIQSGRLVHAPRIPLPLMTRKKS